MKYRQFKLNEIELLISEIDDNDARLGFVLHVDLLLTEEMLIKIRQRWNETWAGAKREVPLALILSRGMDLTTLTDEDLRIAGLVRRASG
jgi:hypothetical protein